MTSLNLYWWAEIVSDLLTPTDSHGSVCNYLNKLPSGMCVQCLVCSKITSKTLKNKLLNKNN